MFIKRYDKIHLASKLIVCVVQCGLVLLHEVIGTVIVLLMMTVLFYFGVNTVAYLLESIVHYKHKHNKI